MLMHLVACLASVPWLFSWAGVFALVAGVYFFGVGINKNIVAASLEAIVSAANRLLSAQAHEEA